MKTVIVVVLASLANAVGEVLVSQGMKRFGERDWSQPSEWLELLLVVLRSPRVLAGVAFMAGFFYLFLAALTWADLSYLNPLTATTYVFTAAFARLFLGEELSWRRWVGTIIVVAGVALISLDTPATKGLYGRVDPPSMRQGASSSR